MELFPAVDLLEGQVVRLTQGDYTRSVVYSSEPAAVAAQFKANGAKNLHLVDLSGAKKGSPVNRAAVESICRGGGLFIELGGGIRDADTVKAYLDLGVSRVILGTAAYKEPDFLAAMLSKYGDKIAVGVDAREGRVAVSGWLDVTGTNAFAFCQRLHETGVQTIIYTDIMKDGALGGANLTVYRSLSAIEGLRIVASGGVSTLSDIAALRAMGIHAAIVGKALYEGRLTLSEALRAAEGNNA